MGSQIFNTNADAELLEFGYLRQLMADHKTPIDDINVCSIYSLEFDQFDQHNNEIEISFQEVMQDYPDIGRMQVIGKRIWVSIIHIPGHKILEELP